MGKYIAQKYSNQAVHWEFYQVSTRAFSVISKKDLTDISVRREKRQLWKCRR